LLYFFQEQYNTEEIKLPLDTRQVIIDALFRLAQRFPEKTSFTLTEIASEAHISRQAIYQKHYRNVQDIIEDIYSQIGTNTREKLTSFPPAPGTSPFQILADELIPVLYEQRDWLRIIYTSSLYTGWFQRLQNNYYTWLRPFVTEASDELQIDSDILLRLLVGYVFDLFVSWLSQPFPLPPEIFKIKFLQLVLLSPNDFIGTRYRI
jgi:AcrR family transcriptional regulator